MIADPVTIDFTQARTEGEARQRVHEVNGTPRFFKDSAYEDTLGVAAELAFAQWSGLDANMDVLPGGDGGQDFAFSLGGRTLSVDVKAAKKPFHLLLKKHEAARVADILVLSGVDGDKVWFLGWEHASLMRVSPARDFGYGIVNHYRHYSELRPMWQLKDLIDRRD
tara:strand:+ start:4021 stop:4518 length:498 start_codon:yes stop_codon:yes gene_type:complete